MPISGIRLFVHGFATYGGSRVAVAADVPGHLHGFHQDHDYCRILDLAGWDEGDMLPFIDLELGSGGPGVDPPDPNYKARELGDAKRVIECTSRYVARVKENLGSDTKVILHAPLVLKELEIKDHMGCDYLWALHCGVKQPDLSGFASLGWTDPQIVLWQYSDGEPDQNKTRSPRLQDRVPGMGPGGCSVFRNGDPYGDLARFKTTLIKRSSPAMRGAPAGRRA